MDIKARIDEVESLLEARFDACCESYLAFRESGVLGEGPLREASRLLIGTGVSDPLGVAISMFQTLAATKALSARKAIRELKADAGIWSGRQGLTEEHRSALSQALLGRG